jgi:hypothetical protein
MTTLRQWKRWIKLGLWVVGYGHLAVVGYVHLAFVGFLVSMCFSFLFPFFDDDPDDDAPLWVALNYGVMAVWVAMWMA